MECVPGGQRVFEGRERVVCSHDVVCGDADHLEGGLGEKKKGTAGLIESSCVTPKPTPHTSVLGERISS